MIRLIIRIRRLIEGSFASIVCLCGFFMSVLWKILDSCTRGLWDRLRCFVSLAPRRRRFSPVLRSAVVEWKNWNPSECPTIRSRRFRKCCRITKEVTEESRSMPIRTSAAIAWSPASLKSEMTCVRCVLFILHGKFYAHFSLRRKFNAYLILCCKFPRCNFVFTFIFSLHCKFTFTL